MTLAALVILGLAGNYFKFTLFFNADFVFGSIFAMVALELFGLSAGIGAGLVISLPLFALWGHPYAIVIMTAEVAAVGWLRRRFRVGLIQADALVWLALGMPLVYVFYHVVMRVAPDHTVFIMAKDMVNGLANVMLARMLCLALALRSSRNTVSFREALYTLFAFFVLTPALVLLALATRMEFNAATHSTCKMLAEDSALSGNRLRTWVENRKSAILNLATLASTSSPAAMQPRLEFAKRADLNFLRVGLLDREATVTAYFPPMDELGRKTLGRNFADRPYLPALRQTLRPMLTEVVLSRFGAPQPMVGLLAPVVKDGAYAGYVIGVLSLEQLKEHLDLGPERRGSFYTLVDRNGLIIMTNHADQKVMAPFVRPRGTFQKLENGVGQCVPELPPNTPAMERWGRSSYLAETPIGSLSEWTLVLEQPMAPFQKALFQQFSRYLGILLLLLVLSLAVAEWASLRMTTSLEALGSLTCNLPSRLAAGTAELPWPESRILESSQLIANFRLMASSLSERFEEARQTNALLERRVEVRTTELSELHRELNLILEHAPIGICKTIEGRQVLVNRRAVEMTGYAKEEMEGRDPGFLYASQEAHDRFERETRPLLNSGRVVDSVQDLIRKDGRTIQARFVGRALDPGDLAKGTIWMVEDITERHRLEVQLHQAQKMESLGRLAGGVAHDMNNVLGAILALASTHVELQPPGPVHSAFTTICAACTRGGNLIRSLLGFARQSLAENKQLDLNALIENEVRILARTTLARVRLDLRLDPALRPMRGDAVALTHLLVNLCVNAVDAMGDHGTLTLATRNLDADWIEATVEDDGAGMTRAVLEKALEPFFTTKAQGKGTGLGLTSVHSTVLAHQGQMELKSEPHRGTRVTLRFPVCQPVLSPTPRVPAGPGQASGSLKILLVDDDELVQISMTTILEILGHTFTAVLCGEDALGALEGGLEPDVVILDMNMPGLGGAGTLPRIRGLRPELPVLLATGRADQSALDLVMAYPGVTLLTKPFTVGDLQNHLQPQ